MARDKLSKAQQKAVDFINSKGATRMGAIGQEVGKMLAEICVELMDSKNEAQHWKAAFDTIQAEFKVAVGIAIKQQGGARLVITRQALSEMPPNTELFLDDHEPGVRVYELRERIKGAPKVGDAVRRIIQPH